MEINSAILAKEKIYRKSIYIYLDGDIIYAYEWSAFMLNRIFPQCQLRKEKLSGGMFVYYVKSDLSILKMLPEYIQVLVDDDYVELQNFSDDINHFYPIWKMEFAQLRR